MESQSRFQTTMFEQVKSEILNVVVCLNSLVYTIKSNIIITDKKGASGFHFFSYFSNKIAVVSH